MFQAEQIAGRIRLRSNLFACAPGSGSTLARNHAQKTSGCCFRFDADRLVPEM